jgi:integrase
MCAIYFRRKGQQKIRLRKTPGTAAFDAEYKIAFSGETPLSPNRNRVATPGTMQWLCEQYYASASFQTLAQSTRKVRRGILEQICQRAGAFRFAIMEPHHVAKLRDEKAAFPEAADNRVKALRQLFAWATSPEYRYATKNPARDVGKLRSKNPDGIKAWFEADAARYEARHPIGTKARLAFDLLLYTGVRHSDVVRLGPQMERDGKLVFNETKGCARVVKAHELPILPPLRRSINATPIGHLVYLVTARGQAHSAKAFGNWFKKRCREVGLEGLSAHGLRKLGAQRCAEAGAREHQLMALFGWTNPQQAAAYTKRQTGSSSRLRRRLCFRHKTTTEVSHFFPLSLTVGQSLRRSRDFSGMRVGDGVPKGIRTPVTAVKGRCPRPLDDGDAGSA